MKYTKYCKNVSKSCLFATVCLFLSTVLPSLSLAQQRPLWELGIGAAAFQLPYYRGSKVGRAYVLPFPYIVYRGEYLNIDDEEISGQMYKSEAVILDLSLGGGVPVPKVDEGPRQGMPGLDVTFEIGPSLEFRLWKDRHNKRKNLWLHLPLRAAFSIGSDGINHQGWIFSPFIEYTKKRFNSFDLEHFVAFGPIFANDRYHDYFYGVDPIYATPTRPAYQGRSGYSGSRITLRTEKRYEDIALSVFLRLDTLNNAVFMDSPLVETRDYYMLGFTVSWIFNRSDELVYSP